MRDASGTLDLKLAQDRSTGLTLGEGQPRMEHERAVTISLQNVNDRLHILVAPHPKYAAHFPVTYAAHPTLTRGELWGKVSNCLSEWQSRVVYFKPRYLRYCPFEEVSHKPLAVLGEHVTIGYRDLLKHIAKAGMILFQQVFLPDAAGDPNYAAIGQIGRALQTLCRIPDLWIRIISDQFYAPWNLMYLGGLEELKRPSASSFWGYQHVIEHDVSDLAVPSPAFKPQMDVALHFDQAIDLDKNLKDFRCNAAIVEHLSRYASLGIREQHFKEGFLENLSEGTHEQLLYFCCHGSGEQAPGGSRPRLMLTDPRPPEEQADNTAREAIEPDEIDLYMQPEKRLQGAPIVFLNCCHAAKMNSTFYQGFAGKFLNRRASAVIGPHVEIPAVFARDFALAFFKHFLEGSRSRNLGTVLLELRRKFFDADENPLGLSYSLYRGGDAYVESPVLLRPSTG